MGNNIVIFPLIYTPPSPPVHGGESPPVYGGVTPYGVLGAGGVTPSGVLGAGGVTPSGVRGGDSLRRAGGWGGTREKEYYYILQESKATPWTPGVLTIMAPPPAPRTTPSPSVFPKSKTQTDGLPEILTTVLWNPLLPWPRLPPSLLHSLRQRLDEPPLK